MQYTHVDCFSGPGGFCTGLHAANFKTLVAIEYVKSCTETYSANHPEVKVIHSDIRKVTEEEILPHIPKKGVDLVTSGMPCETFSTAGNKSRSFYDDRQTLYREGLRIALICKAKFILFENVPAIQTKTISKDSDKLIVDQLYEELEENGYGNYHPFTLHAEEFGVPQMRTRFFILACKDKNIKLRSPETISKFVPLQNLTLPVSTKDAICDLPEVSHLIGEDGKEYLPISNDYTELMKNDSFWKRTGDVAFHGLTEQHPMRHRPPTVERFKLIAQGEGLEEVYKRFNDEERANLIERHVLPKKWFSCRNRRLRENEPAYTLTSHCLEEFIHPTQHRALTVRECARLQSFPDSYVFCGPYSVGHDNREVQDRYEQLGDAVPPLLAYAWGETITELLNELNNKTQ